MTDARPNLDTLPNNFIIPLPQLSAIRLRGEEQQKYLQSQVTCDVNERNSQSLQHGAHCDAKGKVLSVFRLVEHQQALLLIQPEESLTLSLAELKKFGVFAKVEIEQATDIAFAAFVGDDNAQALQTKLGQLPDESTPVVHLDDVSVVYLAGNIHRYLVITAVETLATLVDNTNSPVVDSDVWQLLEISEGFPCLGTDSVQHYVPQMLNLDQINGISFTKGCYLGQETVARMQYLGKNKKMMVQLVGKYNGLLSEDIAVEKQLGENWRSAGEVLNYYQATDGSSYIQAVVGNDIAEQQALRVKGMPEIELSLVTLPYTSTS
ncbi:tRNA-modifying protein YgfZ [Thalassotalea sp. M1531]|uniref:tRNA-modifying protein YgfZ n=1 Tax=Thalassotalea algicola TaxID=2716224 RepID=A0A7Y0Q564_9GAMM|nr:tRNA-modifying protein YgfZ [Thalassotalea algicola]NMP29973.1 tRNA-modifying protein YgfZ [Thalassotalea algicola]